VRLTPVPPTCLRETHGFVTRGDGCGTERVTIPEYPPSPGGEALRTLRVKLGLSLRDAARALGVTAVEMSGVERGSYRPESWAGAAALLQDAARLG
jgi:hypothetical protein